MLAILQWLLLVELCATQVCEFQPVSTSSCPCSSEDTSGCNLPECADGMVGGQMCQADDVLPDGNPDYNIDNCPSGYDVWVCSVCSFQPVPNSSCPCSSNDTSGCDLPGCTAGMVGGQMCEADAVLPDGTSEYEIDNCFDYDVWVCPAPEFWSNVSGPCTISGGCVRSQNYPSNYGNDHSCYMYLAAPSVTVSVTSFDSEAYWDYMLINGQRYSGDGAVSGVLGVTSTISWSSDSSMASSGWEICSVAIALDSSEVTAAEGNFTAQEMEATADGASATSQKMETTTDGHYGTTQGTSTAPLATTSAATPEAGQQSGYQSGTSSSRRSWTRPWWMTAAAAFGSQVCELA